MTTDFYPEAKPHLKKLLIFAGISAGMFLSFHAGSYSQKPETVQKALWQAEEICWKEIQKNGDFKQVHLNSCSAYILKLSQMRLDWQMLNMENSPDYTRFEKEYMKWHKKYRQERENTLNTPGKFAGGSMEPTEHNLRMAELIGEQIKKLKKICKH